MAGICGESGVPGLAQSGRWAPACLPFVRLWLRLSFAANLVSMVLHSPFAGRLLVWASWKSNREPRFHAQRFGP